MAVVASCQGPYVRPLGFARSGFRRGARGVPAIGCHVDPTAERERIFDNDDFDGAAPTGCA